MRRPVVEEIPALEETSDLLGLALGALSCAARIDELLEPPAPEKRRGRKPTAPPDPALAALLGLVSLRRTLLRWLAAASAEATQGAVRDEESRAPWQNVTGGWLR